MADALDSKSSNRKVVWVQVPPPVLTLFLGNYRWLVVTPAGTTRI
jgi:hypothetical protein